jgi:hypothetical protein
MKKLSEQFLEAGQRTAALESQAAATNAKNRKEFEAKVAEARAAVRSAKAAFTAKLDKMDEDLAEQWREVDEAFAAQMAVAQRRMDEHLNAIDLASARADAEDAEAYAEIAAEFSRLTASEAETAMIQAKQARATAQSLE